MTNKYLHDIRNQLPGDAFDPKPAKIIFMTAHVCVSYLCFAAAAQAASLWQMAVLGLISGHSLTCMGFMAHELSHGMIIKNRKWRSIFEMCFWGTVFVAPTMWRRTHNSTHHHHYGTLRDSDRPFVDGEQSGITKWYVRLFYPNHEVFPWNPLVLLYQLPYFTRNTLAAFIPRGKKPGFMPAVPDYKNGDSWRVLTEIMVIILIQGTFLAAADFNWMVFTIMAVITQLTASVIVMTYVFTNHFLKPVTESSDPLKGSTSVIVPKWIDRLHSHFSYHSEHHLFPNLRSEYYPRLSSMLAAGHPGEYHRIPLLQAWRLLWKNPSFHPHHGASLGD